MSAMSNTQIRSEEIKLGDFIAAGGMGKVYKAKWQHHEVAVKQLLVGDLSQAARAEFNKETEIMALLRHPNVVQFFGVCTDQRPFQMVMEYMSGGSLYGVLRSNRVFSWAERYRIALDTAAGVSYLHGSEIVHRDLKSLNILLDNNYRAKLTDFGLATVKKETSTQSKQDSAGTLLWMAPELFKRGGRCTPASDIYGLGMVFWELSSGEVPWNEASNPHVVMGWVMQGEREEIPEETPDVYKLIIEKCWEQEPHARPTAETVVLQLTDLVESSTPNLGGKAEADPLASGPLYDTALASRAPSATVMSGPNYALGAMSRQPPSTGPVYATGLQTQSIPGESDYKAGLALYLKSQYRSSLPHFEKAASMDYPPAYLRLNGLYKNGGRIGPKDPKQAAYWSEKAADKIGWFKSEAAKGGADAQRNLGLCYYYGIGVSKDFSEAVRWYLLAADQGDAMAQNRLGFCYKNGEGVAKNLSEAVLLYRIAADQGNAYAQNNLGACYYNGLGVPKDFSEAVRWYRLAADQGDAMAQNRLGFCYKSGEGVAKNLSEAVRWYRLAADQGHAQAQYNLGWCYKSGEGVAKNLSEAVRWYRLAADQGHAQAQYNLGRYYKKGAGVAQDLSEAARWYRLAADQGFAGAQDRLNSVLKKIKVQRN